MCAEVRVRAVARYGTNACRNVGDLGDFTYERCCGLTPCVELRNGYFENGGSYVIAPSMGQISTIPHVATRVYLPLLRHSNFRAGTTVHPNDNSLRIPRSVF